MTTIAYPNRPASGYQPCETFFVECDDYSLPQPSAKEQAKREHAKLLARERQYAIADQLSKIASDEFREDVLSHMLEMDVSRLGHLVFFLFHADLFCLRAKLFPTSSPSTFRPRFSGSCDRTFWTS